MFHRNNHNPHNHRGHSIRKVIFASFVLTAFLFFFTPAFSAEPVVDLISTYTGGILSGQTPSGQLEPSSGIELTTVFNGDPAICSGPLGYKLFRTMAHGIGGDEKKIEYLAKGSGDDLTFSYNFNSGPTGQKNLYWAVFYCWSSSAPETALGTAKQWAKQWKSEVFNQDTLGGACNLTNAKWGSSSLIVGKDVTLSVDGTLGCKGRDFKFELWKGGTGLGSRLETSIDAKFPDTGTPPFTITKTWKVTTDNSYIFKARVPSPNGSVLVSGELSSSGGGDGTGKTGTSSLEFSNPLGSATLQELIDALTRWIFWLAIPIAVMMIIYAGLVMLASGGDPAKFTKGKEILKWTVVGLAVLFIGKGFTYLVESIINLKNR